MSTATPSSASPTFWQALSRAFSGLWTKARQPSKVHHSELLCVQRLRGFAVLMVLIVHIEDIAQRLPGWEGYHSTYSRLVGYSAPDMFFVISGFIMSYITFSVPFEPRRWLISRFMRIYPMYAIFMLMSVGLWLHNPMMTMGSGQHGWDTVIASLLMLPQDGLPLLFIGWTIEHEIVFYSTVFFTATFLGRERLFAVMLTLSGLAFVKWSYIQLTGTEVWDFHIASLYMVQFCMGAMVFRGRQLLLRLGSVWPFVAAALLIAAGAAWAEAGTMNHEQPLRVLFFGGAYSMILTGMLNREHVLREHGRMPTHRDAWVWIGDASYSIYLTHPFVLGSLGKVFMQLDPPWWGDYLCVILAGVLVLTVGFATHFLLERPVIEMGKWMTRRPSLSLPKKDT